MQQTEMSLGVLSMDRYTFARSFTYETVKSDKVNAPVIEEFPVVMECELL
jgi:flavin reductase (DIM6/NTAB) family NADH-FMN oxidoreductase RutF